MAKKLKFWQSSFANVEWNQWIKSFVWNTKNCYDLHVNAKTVNFNEITQFLWSKPIDYNWIGWIEWNVHCHNFGYGTLAPFLHIVYCVLFLVFFCVFLFTIVVDLFRSISLSFSCKHLSTKIPLKLNRLWITFRLIANKKGRKSSRAPKNQKKNRFNSFPHFFRCLCVCVFFLVCLFSFVILSDELR